MRCVGDRPCLDSSQHSECFGDAGRVDEWRGHLVGTAWFCTFGGIRSFGFQFECWLPSPSTGLRLDSNLLESALILLSVVIESVSVAATARLRSIAPQQGIIDESRTLSVRVNSLEQRVFYFIASSAHLKILYMFLTRDSPGGIPTEMVRNGDKAGCNLASEGELLTVDGRNSVTESSDGTL